ncbi:hypothetical protein TCSYLVIO_001317, partial [Trypanosoma cruzi]
MANHRGMLRNCMEAGEGGAFSRNVVPQLYIYKLDFVVVFSLGHINMCVLKHLTPFTLPACLFFICFPCLHVYNIYIYGRIPLFVCVIIIIIIFFRPCVVGAHSYLFFSFSFCLCVCVCVFLVNWGGAEKGWGFVFLCLC